jgi:hypothetical protein
MKSAGRGDDRNQRSPEGPRSTACGRTVGVEIVGNGPGARRPDPGSGRRETRRLSPVADGPANAVVQTARSGRTRRGEAIRLNRKPERRPNPNPFVEIDPRAHPHRSGRGPGRRTSTPANAARLTISAERAASRKSAPPDPEPEARCRRANRFRVAVPEVPVLVRRRRFRRPRRRRGRAAPRKRATRPTRRGAPPVHVCARPSASCWMRIVSRRDGPPRLARRKTFDAGQAPVDRNHQRPGSEGQWSATSSRPAGGVDVIPPERRFTAPET